MSSKRKLIKDSNQNDVITNKKKITSSILSPLSYPPDVTKRITNAFREKADLNTEDITYSVKPFPHWCVNNFINDLELLKKLKKDLLKLKFQNKYTDLFKFSQSEDIRENKVKSISTFRENLFTDFRGWLEKILDTKLSDSIDMSCAKYEYTDFLLCHDDKVEDRQLAFIYYLVPEDWSQQDGGKLDLFNNKDGQPTDLCKSLVPTHNSLVFFQVNDTSFHQVSEILSENKTRLSISGWFHSVTDPQFQHNKFVEQVKRMTPLDVEQELLLEWIDRKYLLTDITDDIQKEFEENSEIQLNDFLRPEMYEKLADELRSMKQDCWKEKGPINKRKLVSLQEDKLDPNGIVCKFLQLVRSGPFFKLLCVFTDLDLAHLDSENGEVKFTSKPTCVVETRQWKHGCFTILEDSQFEGEACLDCIFNVSCEAFEESDRGYISYVAGEETEELVTVFPTCNCLTLVYRDENTTRFVKYFDNDYCGNKKEFFDFDMIYYEGKKENDEKEE